MAKKKEDLQGGLEGNDEKLMPTDHCQGQAEQRAQCGMGLEMSLTVLAALS